MLLNGLWICSYNDQSSNQGAEVVARNRNKFDLVISDVHMPDMDGFKLLELVGLEMDLPVISKPVAPHNTHIVFSFSF